MHAGEMLGPHYQDTNHYEHTCQARAEGQEHRQGKPKQIRGHGNQKRQNGIPTRHDTAADAQHDESPPPHRPVVRRDRVNVSMLIVIMVGVAMVMGMTFAVVMVVRMTAP